MCNFCELKEKSFYGLKGSDKKGYGYSPRVFIQKDNYDNQIYLCACGEDDTKFIINYCPMCGEKLD